VKAVWRLSPETKDRTIVSLSVEYSFRIRLYRGLASQFASSVAEKLVEAFERRAIEKLGRR